MKDLRSSKQLIITFFRRYHLVLFTVVTVMLLSVAILILSGIVGKAGGVDTPPQSGVSTTFDQDTIDRIERLKTSDQQSESLDLSKGRINPFGE